MERISKLLESNTAALILTDVNRRYLTGFESSLGYLFISKNEACLFVDGRYILAAEKAVNNAKVECFTRISDSLKKFAERNGITSVICENSITVERYSALCEMLAPITVTADATLNDAVSGFRRKKTATEVESIVKAQRIAERAFEETLNIIKPGIGEREVAAYLEYSMKRLGSEAASFETIAVSGKKSAMPHGVPDGKLIENGDFLTLDFGAVCDGYHSDMTRTVAVGYATDKMRLVYDTVLAAQKAAEKKAAPGVCCADVDRAAREVIEAAGFGDCFTHSTGHGVGVEIHEAPNVSSLNLGVLECGDLITDEPGIYIRNEFGVRIEDMLFVTEKSCENLTKCEKSLIIL